MAPHKSAPWRIRRQPGSKNLYVRFSHQGVRYEESAGTQDPGEAEKHAAKLYAEVVAGAHKPRARLLIGDETLVAEAASLWLASIHYEAGPYLTYVRHWQEHFLFLRRLFLPGAVDAYWKERLGVALWQTVNKERGPLREFIDWCASGGLVSAAPEVPPLPSRKRSANKGTAHKRGRNSKGVWIPYAQARQVVEALPEFAESKRAPRFSVRARFAVMLETSLRPKTLDLLRVPEHYRKGQAFLDISADIDKNRYARQLPLSEEARAALDSVCPERGPIFGKHDYREQLAKAAKAVLPEDQAALFTAYDLRRCALTTFGDTGDLHGTAFMAGHKQLTTSSIYIRPERASAERMLRTIETRRSPADAARAGVVAWGSREKARQAAGPSDLESSAIPRLCEGEDSNLHRSYPTSTSS